MRRRLNKQDEGAAAPRGPRALDEALERWRGFLRERQLRSTGAREAIIRAIMSRPGHFEVDALVEALEGQGIAASRATVYRALPLLMEAGIVEPTLISGEKRVFEAAVGRAHHDHLVCSRCGDTVEFQFEAFEVLQEEVAAKYGYQLTQHFHELIGVCPACQKRERGARPTSRRGRAS